MNEDSPHLLLNKKILVADDEPALCDIFREDLEAIGAEVVSACDGNKAFDLAMSVSPDAVISDIRMPECDGLEFLRRLREAKKDLLPPVIFVTGFADLSLDRAKELGAVELLAKPFALRELRRVVCDALRVVVPLAPN